MSDHHFNRYFIVEKITTATSVIDILKESGVRENNIGVVSNNNDIVLADLPEADLTERSTISASLKRGALLGSGSGLLAGVLVSIFPVAGLVVGGAAIAGMTAGGAALGAWSASMIGVSENSPLVKQFEHSLDEKKTLIFCKLTAAEEQNVQDKFTQIESTEYRYGKLDEHQ